jgi:hypothetical protein
MAVPSARKRVDASTLVQVLWMFTLWMFHFLPSFRMRRAGFSAGVALLAATLFLSACSSSPAPVANATTTFTPWAICGPSNTVTGCIGSTQPPPAIVNVPYAWGLRTNAGLKSVNATLPITFQVEEGSTLPPGLTLDPNGALHGVPTQTGGFVFNVVAVDSFPNGPRSIAAGFSLDVRLPGALLTEVGENDLGGRGDNADVFVHNNTAFVGTTCSGGPSLAAPGTVNVVDLTNPASPQLIAHTPSPNGSSGQREVKVQTVTTSSGKTIDLMAVSLQPCSYTDRTRNPPATTYGGQGGVELWDVSAPSRPLPLGFWPAGTGVGGNGQSVPLSVHDAEIVSGGGKIYVLAAVAQSEFLGTGAGDLRILDASDPTNPVEVGSWSLLSALGITTTDIKTLCTEGSTFGLSCGQDQRIFLDSISISSDQKYAFLGYWDEGFVVLQINGPGITPPNVANLQPDGSANPTYNPKVLLDHTLYLPTSIGDLAAGANPPEYPTPEGNTHAVLPIAGTGLLATDEVCGSQKNWDTVTQTFSPVDPTASAAQAANYALCGFDVNLDAHHGWGFLRTYSFGTDSLGTPTANGVAPIGAVATPQSQAVPAPDAGIYSAYNMSWNGDSANPHAYVSWFSNGLVDLGLQTLNPPQILTVFSPPAVADPNSVLPTVPLVFGAAPYQPSGGNRYVVASDVNSGLWLLQETAGPEFVILTSSVPQGNQGVPYSTDFQAANADGTVRWSTSDGNTLVPPGLEFGSGTNCPLNTLCGTPTAAGTYQFNVVASDSSGAQVAKPITLVVTRNFAIVPATPPLGTINEPYTFTLLSANGVGSSVTWSISSGTLPHGLTLAPTTGIISGTPDVAGNYTFTVGAADSASPPNTATQAFTITIDPLAFMTTSLPDGVVGQPYPNFGSSASVSNSGFQFQMQNGTKPYTFALAPGSTLPVGLALASNGTLSGIPTVPSTRTFTVNVTDASGDTASGTFTLVVDPFSIVDTTLPPATVGTGYLQGIRVDGGRCPFVATVSVGTLPPGLSVQGAACPADKQLEETGAIVKGVPTAAGSSTFTIQVTDSNNNTVSQQYTLTVQPGS